MSIKIAAVFYNFHQHLPTPEETGWKNEIIASKKNTPLQMALKILLWLTKLTAWTAQELTAIYW